MWIKGVNFPNVLIDSQRSGRLVLFAGAGVSKDPPSDYPDFEGLAAEVGGPAHPRRKGESLEVYLGRLETSGIKVHDQVRQILSSPTSRPNPNHYALIDLFKSQDCCRLVTTNFDTHFATASRERFGDIGPEIFYAPALPLGSRFTGIINLHGSVDREPYRMVLTDADFARAYINEGWATRFLERLFSHFVVLFVGYSHQDMLMTYLARGLTTGSSGPGRFALTPPNDDARWENLAITPVHYPVAEPPQPRHGQLTLALGTWAEQSQAGALAVENRVRTIVTGSASVSREEDDFLADALSDLSRLRFFTRHARGTQWLTWAEHQRIFQAIFETRTDYSEKDWELASWFAREYAIQHADKALDVIRRRGIGQLVWRQISLELFRAKANGTVPTDSLSKWVSVLIATAGWDYRNEELEYVLSRCKYPEDGNVALLLFEHLTKPQVRLKESLRWLKDENTEANEVVDMEISCAGSEHWLAKAWSDLFSPNLNAVAKQVSPIISGHLSSARRMHLGFGKNTSFDRLSFSRGMVESRSQDHLRSGISVLIDAGAEVLRWSAGNDQNWLTALTTDWFTSESPVLRRLAIFGTAISPHVQGDDKILWAVQQRLLHQAGIKHEFFLLLQEAYPQASRVVREKLLTAIQERYDIEGENAEIAAYELFNIVNWLAQADPKCEIAAKLRKMIAEEHPTFGEREHPDMDSWIGGVSTLNWGGASEDLTTYDLDSLLKMLEKATEDYFPQANSKQALIQSIGQSAQKTHAWGINIAREAQQASVWRDEVWRPLLEAWGAADLSEQDWVGVFDVLDLSSPIYKSGARQMAWLLERGAQSSSKPIPPNLIPRAKAIADRIWENIQQEEPEEIVGDIDWLGRAINHPAGQIFGFYLPSLARSREGNVSSPDLLDDYKRTFVEAVNGSSVSSQLARVVLASQIHFLFHLDRDWTVQNIFPLLDPNRDPQRATQCWNGYLYWGRWTDAMLKDLLPSYEGMFGVIETEKDEVRRMFCGHLAGIAIYSSIHPLDSGWLFRFLEQVNTDTKSVWAGEFRSIIAGLDGDAKLHLWKRWLNTYWQQRVVGRPTPLTGKEVAHMIDWALNLEPVFSDAIKLAQKGVHPEFEHSMVYYQISESKLLESSPDAMVDLLAFLTAGEKGRPIYDLDRLYNATERLVDLVPKNPTLKFLCDKLAFLGIPNVESLAKRLDPPYNVG